MYVALDDISGLPAGSKKKVRCRCDCGNPSIIHIPRNALDRSCGSCDLNRWIASGKREYGKLYLCSEYSSITALRHPASWRCECGVIKDIPVYRVLSGNTTSCGCAHKTKKVKNPAVTRSKAQWIELLPNICDEVDLPDSWGSGSRRPFKIRCACGKVYERLMNGLTATSTCGHCDDIELNPGDRHGNLTYSGDAVTTGSRTRKKVAWKCDCGTEKEIAVYYVLHSGQTSCGKCNTVRLDDLKSKKYGSLEYLGTTDLLKYSAGQSLWRCACGTEKEIITSNVLNGTTKSCGACRLPVATWYNVHRNTIKSLKCPIQPSQIPMGGPIFQEVILNTKVCTRAVCVACGSEYSPRWEGVRLGVSLTCGCSSNRVSTPVAGITDMLKSAGLSVENEYSVGGLKYDIAIPSERLLIEFNGLKWHSNDGSRVRDFVKYRNSIELGYRHIMVFEDEWREKPDIVKSILLNAAGKRGCHDTVRASTLQVHEVSAAEADEFYLKNHYLGSSLSKYNFALKDDGEIIACMSFKPPTRQSKYDLELSRACVRLGTTLHGGLSKLLSYAKSVLVGKSVVSFSDNRLFSGQVYGKLGFLRSGITAPDYYWVKGSKRYNKSGLRKPEGETRTEGEIRVAEGYNRIYDLGKTRWVLNF